MIVRSLGGKQILRDLKLLKANKFSYGEGGIGSKADGKPRLDQ